MVLSKSYHMEKDNMRKCQTFYGLSGTVWGCRTKNNFTYPYYLIASEQCSLFPTGIALILGIIIWSWKRTCNSLDGHTLLKPRLGNRYVYSSCVWKMNNCRCLVLSSVWKWKYSTTIHTTTFCQMMEDSFLICSPVTKNPWTGGWWWK